MKPRQCEHRKIASGKNEMSSSVSRAGVQTKHQQSIALSTMNIKQHQQQQQQQQQQKLSGNPNELSITAVRSEISFEPNDDCQASNEMMTTTKNKATNLIGEMINDVSKTIKITTTNTNTLTNNNNNSNSSTMNTTSESKSFIGNNEFVAVAVDDCVGDFPIKAAYTGGIADVSKTVLRSRRTRGACGGKLSSTINTTPTTATMRMNTKRKILPATPTKPVTTTQATTTAATTTTTTKNRISRITPTTTTTTTTSTTTTPNAAKKSFTLRKNKCPAIESHEISSPRALKANTTSASPIYGRIKNKTIKNNKLSQPKSIRCELLESPTPSKTTPTISKACNKDSILSTTNRKNLSHRNTVLSRSHDCTLSLSEEKARLRSDFFKDILSENTVEKTEIQAKESQPQEELPAIRALHSSPILEVTRPLDCDLRSHPVFHYDEECESDYKDETTIVLLPIPSIKKPTLIEQRKLELIHKFSAQVTTRRKQSPLNKFRRVAHLVNKFEMIVNPNKTVDMTEQSMMTLKPDGQEQRHSSPLSDEGCNLGQSPYSTDDEHDNNDENTDAASIRSADTTIETLRCATKRKDKVARSASSDSALGLEVDDPMDASTSTSATTIPSSEQQQKRRMTLTVTDLPLRPALLPLAEPTTLPDSPIPELQQTLQNLLAQTSVPSKVLLEERVVGIPEDSLLRTNAPSAGSLDNSRRESAQSCFSDYPFSDCGGVPGVRYVRTPSVVVSDYSDDVMCGITLEEIEYFRQQRLRRRSSLDTTGTEKDSDLPSDVSVASSCSNLYYCGSTISALDGSECLVNGMRVPLQRKSSNCSSCSVSANEDDTTSTSSSAFTLTEENTGTDIADLLAAQHLSSKRPKQVGGVTDLDISGKRY